MLIACGDELELVAAYLRLVSLLCCSLLSRCSEDSDAVRCLR